MIFEASAFLLASKPLMLGWMAVSDFGRRRVLPDLAICSVAQGKSWHGKAAGAGLSLGHFDMAVFVFLCFNSGSDLAIDISRDRGEEGG